MNTLNVYTTKKSRKQRLPISLVITILNEEKTIPDLLFAIESQTHLPSEILFVDGGSSDNSKKMLENWKEKCQSHNFLHDIVIIIKSKVGNISQGRNTAITLSSYSWIAITDAGCVPQPTWLHELWLAATQSSFESDKAALQRAASFNRTTPNKAPSNKIILNRAIQVDIVAGYYRGLAQTAFEYAVIPFVLVQPDQINPNDFLPATRSMLMKKKVWQNVGGFREDLRVSEDYVFALEAQKKGFKIVFTQRAVVGWYPRSSLKSFVMMVLAQAYYDEVGGVRRKKVNGIFFRYLIGVTIFSFGWWYVSFSFSLIVSSLLFLFYVLWSVVKHRTHFPQKGWYFLPVLQIFSDVAIIIATFFAYLVTQSRTVQKNNKKR